MTEAVDNMKEINEAYDAIELIVEQAGKIVEGGIDLSDLTHLIPLASKFEVLKNGVEGIGEVKLKDLSEAEVIETVMRSYNLVKKVLEIKK